MLRAQFPYATAGDFVGIHVETRGLQGLQVTSHTPRVQRSEAQLVHQGIAQLGQGPSVATALEHLQ